MIGYHIGRLTVISQAGRDRKRNILWRCACECGNETIAAGWRLRKGEPRSCGCLQRELVTAKNSTHRLCGTRLYNIWSNMLARCERDTHPQFSDYGGRGIHVCDDWKEFQKFHEWSIVNGYKDGLSIDRINNDSGYCPENCRWATALQQSRNKRPRRDQKLTDDQVKSIRDDTRQQSVIADAYSIRQQHVSRIKSGKRRNFPTGEQHHV